MNIPNCIETSTCRSLFNQSNTFILIHVFFSLTHSNLLETWRIVDSACRVAGDANMQLPPLFKTVSFAVKGSDDCFVDSSPKTQMCIDQILPRSLCFIHSRCVCTPDKLAVHEARQFLAFSCVQYENDKGWKSFCRRGMMMFLPSLFFSWVRV